MSEQIEIIEEETTSVFEPVTKIGRKAIYFGLGAVGMVGDGVKGVVSRSGEYSGKLVERGEKVASDTRKRVAKVSDGRQDIAKDTVKKAGDRFDRYSEQVLTRVHIPTSEDLESVTKKVASIERKLDRAIKEASGSTSTKTAA